jgi:hypothetical protein
VGERLEDDVVAALRPRGAIPRPVKSNEGAAAIGLHALVDLQIIWRPVSGKCGDRRLLLRAITDLFAAIAAIFRRQDELLLLCVVVALRPAVIGAFFKNHRFLRGLLKALPGGVQLGPIFMQLIAAMLGHEKPSLHVKVEALAVAQAGRIALLGREPLVRLVGVVAPDAASRLKLGAGLCPGECGIRFFTSQALVAEPRSTNKLPRVSIANGCMG